ncbi:hypothetical protein ACA910_008144 [Epithemia clementina (nom. ined.)]
MLPTKAIPVRPPSPCTPETFEETDQGQAARSATPRGHLPLPASPTPVRMDNQHPNDDTAPILDVPRFPIPSAISTSALEEEISWIERLEHRKPLGTVTPRTATNAPGTSQERR